MGEQDGGAEQDAMHLHNSVSSVVCCVMYVTGEGEQEWVTRTGGAEQEVMGLHNSVLSVVCCVMYDTGVGEQEWVSTTGVQSRK